MECIKCVKEMTYIAYMLNTVIHSVQHNMPRNPAVAAMGMDEVCVY